MLFPRSHAWTALQRLLITITAVLAFAAVGTLVYSYEHYHRGLSEDALLGTWETSLDDADSPVYLQFHPNQTFSMFSSLSDIEETTFITGRWYAGGENIYVRLNWVPVDRSRPQVWHIVDIAPGEFRVRLFSDYLRVFKRVGPYPNGS